MDSICIGLGDGISRQCPAKARIYTFTRTVAIPSPPFLSWTASELGGDNQNPGSGVLITKSAFFGQNVRASPRHADYLGQQCSEYTAVQDRVFLDSICIGLGDGISRQCHAKARIYTFTRTVAIPSPPFLSWTASELGATTRTPRVES